MEWRGFLLGYLSYQPVEFRSGGLVKPDIPLDAVDFVALFEQELRQVRSILSCDARNQCFLHLCPFRLSFPRRKSQRNVRHYLSRMFFQSSFVTRHERHPPRARGLSLRSLARPVISHNFLVNTDHLCANNVPGKVFRYPATSVAPHLPAPNWIVDYGA